MSNGNAPGSGVTLSSAEPDLSKLDRSYPYDALSDSSTASLSDDPWVKALFGFSQAAAAGSRLAQREVCGILETGAGTGPECGASVSGARRLQPAEPTVGETTASLYSLADLAPQLANPLAPLRDRDRQALTEIFTHQHMVAIEADILTRLISTLSICSQKESSKQNSDEGLRSLLQWNLCR